MDQPAELQVGGERRHRLACHTDAADFEQKGDPGIWWKTLHIEGTTTDVEVDLMVPQCYAPAGGRRSARLPPHNKMIARKAIGLEGSILDHDLIEVSALDGADPRRCTVCVAGPAALVVAKVYKLRDRLAEGKTTVWPTRMPPTCIG